MKVVVAVDGSRHGRWATQWISRMPWKLTPDISALHVLDISSVRATFVIQPTVIGNERFIRDEIKRLVVRKNKVVADTEAALRSVGLKGAVRTEKGPVANTIVRNAPKRNGMLVVGSRGLDKLDRLMLGSVSLHATLHASCPVFVAKARPRPIRRIVLAVDGSKSAEKAAHFLTKVLSAKTSTHAIQVMIVHVMPSIASNSVKEAASKLTSHYSHRLRAAGYQVKEILLKGNPAEKLVPFVARQKADFIVMGARGLGAIARFLLGSVSLNVVQLSRCSVLIVR